MTNGIILENVSAESLKEIIQEAVRKELAALPGKKETIYLTRSEVVKLLHISLPSIDKAIKTGKLKAYRINGRILFKESEIDLAIIPILHHIKHP